MLKFEESLSLDSFPVIENKRPFAAKFYAYDPGGTPKPKKQEVAKTSSVFKRTNETGFNSDFGNASTTMTPYMYTDPLTGQQTQQHRLETTTSLPEDLKQARTAAGTGLNSNLGFLQMNPNEQYDYMRAGNDPMYNLLSDQTQRNTDKALGRSLVNSRGLGTQNSTTAGAAQAGILNDSLLRANNDLLQAFTFGNENSRANLGANLNTLGSLANLVYPLGSASNANFMQAMASRDAASASTAAAQNAANMQYAQAMNQYNQQKSAGLGNMIGGGIGALGSLALAPFTGGMSLMAMPGALSGMFSGGGGGGGSYTPMPSYGFANNIGGLANQFGTMPSGQLNTRIGIGGGLESMIQ